MLRATQACANRKVVKKLPMKLFRPAWRHTLPAGFFKVLYTRNEQPKVEEKEKAMTRKTGRPSKAHSRAYHSALQG